MTAIAFGASYEGSDIEVDAVALDVVPRIGEMLIFDDWGEFESIHFRVKDVWHQEGQPVYLHCIVEEAWVREAVPA